MPEDGKRTADDATLDKAERKAARKAARKADKKAQKQAEKEQPVKAEATSSPLTDSECARFADAPFAEPVIKALSAEYNAPTEIQAKAWPVALMGRDLIAVAKTGSGKTLGFVLPMLHRMSTISGAPRSVRTLVLSPTRELAAQIHVQAERFARLVGLSTLVIYGGTPLKEQKQAIASTAPAMVIATPGRLVDLLGQGAIKLSACHAIVLDEADRLLDMGFKPQLEATYKALPSERQTLLFSATWPKAVRKLAAAYLRDSQTTSLFLGGAQGSSAGGDAEGDADTATGGTGVDACELSANVAVSQSFVQATDDVKDEKLWALLSELEEGARVIVFANTKRRVDNLARIFADFGTCALHGDKSQPDREKALAGFVSNASPLMVATDVAARGLDIKLVTHVINYDMARDVESYVHRIGRTGRAGAVGKSVTFWNPDYDKECAPALVRIARKAGQAVPDWLAKFETGKANKLWAVAKADKEVAELAAEIGKAKAAL